MNSFINETEDGKNYLIEDILADGACFYRAFGNSLIFLSKIDKIKDLTSIEHQKLHTIEWDMNHLKNIDDFINKMSYGNGLKIQTYLAKYIQSIAKKWIINHYLDKMDSGETIGECLRMTHSILNNPELKTIKDVIKYYNVWYDYFSGDKITYNDNGKEYILHDRWASTIEQYALSKLFQIPIFIYIDQRYDEKNDKIINGLISLTKGQTIGSTRLRLISLIGQEYISESKPQIKLLYRVDNKKGLHHYMVLYPKNQKKI
jgi:hypothetical protein